ncbi:MAG: hypothetical protein WC975_10330 [Phycisphaerae bacterium]
MPAIKLCIIGGGSHYTHHMLATFAHHVKTGDLAGSTIGLYDIHHDNARLMADFGNAVARAKRLDFKVEFQDRLEKALEGADFVFSSIRVGGFDQLEVDEEIPLKCGLFGQETTGVSGVFFMCRQAPVITQHARTIEAVCPQAIVINYSNPSGMVTDLTRRVTKLNCLGLCDGVYGAKWLVCILLGLPMSEANNVHVHVAGVNHCTWALAIRYKGEDLYPRIGELFEKLDWKDEKKTWGWNKDLEQWYRLYRYYGILPGSTFYARYHYYARSFAQEMLEGYRLSRGLRENSARLWPYIKSQIGKPDADFMDAGGESAHGDQAMGALWKMACDTGELETVNVRNDGAVANLPDDAIVEVPAIMTRQGAFPLRVGPLPEPVVSKVHATATHYRLAVDAAMSGDRNLVMQAAMAFPSNTDIDLMEKIVAELFEKHKSWLPQFNVQGSYASRRRKSFRMDSS